MIYLLLFFLGLLDHDSGREPKTAQCAIGNCYGVDGAAAQKDRVVVELKYAPGKSAAQLVIDAAAKVQRKARVAIGVRSRSAGDRFGEIPPRHARECLRERREAARTRKPNLRTAGDVV